MSLPMFVACIWVLLATATAFLPMRLQFVPGLSLLIAAPLLLGWIATVHGWWIFGLGLAAFLSMFRNPLIYFYKRAKGLQPEIPK